MISLCWLLKYSWPHLIFSGGSGPAPPGNGSSSQPPPGGPQGDNSAGGPGSDQPLVWWRNWNKDKVSLWHRKVKLWPALSLNASRTFNSSRMIIHWWPQMACYSIQIPCFSEKVAMNFQHQPEYIGNGNIWNRYRFSKNIFSHFLFYIVGYRSKEFVSKRWKWKFLPFIYC